MRRRFLLSVLISDLVALALGFVVASLVVFGTPLMWDADTPGGASIWPMVAFGVVGLLVGSYGSLRMWAQGAPRPSYGRALAIVGFTAAFTAAALVIARDVYFSRQFLAVTFGVFLVGALGHRALRRRRPWTEKLVLVTGEKTLADDLRTAAHADVLAVYDPSGDPPSAPEANVTLVVDLRPVMSDQMAQFVSSWNLAGYPVSALSSVYEEYTGRLPMVHLAEGWELSAPVSRNEYAPFKRFFDIVLTVITAPIWAVMGALITVAVKIDSRGPAIYRQRRVGRGGEVFTLYKFRTMILDAERNGPQFAAVGDDLSLIHI